LIIRHSQDKHGATRPLIHALTIKTNKSDESNLNQNTYINQNKLQKQKLKFTEQNLSISIRCNIHSEAFVNKASTTESGIAFQISNISDIKYAL